ncbi:cyclic pyranopterin monophosphate synthase MoaC [Caldalkalibacillus salinus]|uniref:cyclic pyranopterin monophosphate synthase MoaC n=1 Tax=Caldalkalibacillus salinus TaxID=2803787 RepID=UPI0019212EAC|nr:cyclic pyranopterin monophosphate synthase MoaC [Caldalkalibacillus salinus]
MGSFTHFNKQARPKMVDISDKQVTTRVAVAHSEVQMGAEVYHKIEEGKIGKGDVLSVAQIAGVMAAKKTSDIIPMCHPLSLSGVDITFRGEKLTSQSAGQESKSIAAAGEQQVEYEQEERFALKIEVTVKTDGKTGVEMEALTAASVSALTIYDMCKAIDKGMILGPTYLASKSGGKSGDYQRKLKEEH